MSKIKWLIVIILLFNNIIMAQWMSGSGTNIDPYLVWDADDLDSIRIKGVGKVYSIQSNIDLISYSNWIPLGTTVSAFTGQLWGNGFMISNMKQTIETANNGLLGYCIGDTVINLYLNNCLIDVAANNSHSGILSSFSATSAYYDSIYIFNSKINLKANSHSAYIGIMVGRIFSGCTITNSQAVNDTIIEVNGLAGVNVGTGYGIIAGNNGGTLNKTFVYNSYIEHRNDGNDDRVGGLCGYSGGTISNCYVAKTIVHDLTTSDPLDAFLGAVFGNMGSGTITNVFSSSICIYDVITASNNIFAGYQTASAATCYADGELYSETLAKAQGAGTAANVEATADMLLQGTYSGWDFSTVWGIDPLKNDGYPYLLTNEPASLPEPPPVHFLFRGLLPKAGRMKIN